MMSKPPMFLKEYRKIWKPLFKVFTQRKKWIQWFSIQCFVSIKIHFFSSYMYSDEALNDI
ncbi:hypothetical protein RHMOL_Rhmol03G0177500 [Rhododendron molle]|uniref:Uncharacterized protein n=1 Tax=Rhododendron molle TaxID=49168 RepID=A0ACC0PG18_RHOML|nr:hypothetical protein RHMOL_Rhmol03G0177500 [Rhododendron molle]